VLDFVSAAVIVFSAHVVPAPELESLPPTGST
jgi:hypothetical protein